MTTAILLASGFSSRMGCDKLLLDYKGKPIIAHVADAISHSRVDASYIVTNNPRLTKFSPGFSVISNSRAYEGKSAAIRSGVLAAQPYTRYFFFVADQPLISCSIINGFISMSDNFPRKIIAASANGIRGNPVLFPYAYREKLLSLTGDCGGRELLNTENTLEYNIAQAVLEDIDIPADYARLLSAAESSNYK